MVLHSPPPNYLQVASVPPLTQSDSPQLGPWRTLSVKGERVGAVIISWTCTAEASPDFHNLKDAENPRNKLTLKVS